MPSDGTRRADIEAAARAEARKIAAEVFLSLTQAAPNRCDVISEDWIAGVIVEEMAKASRDEAPVIVGKHEPRYQFGLGDAQRVWVDGVPYVPEAGLREYESLRAWNADPEVQHVAEKWERPKPEPLPADMDLAEVSARRIVEAIAYEWVYGGGHVMAARLLSDWAAEASHAD